MTHKLHLFAQCTVLHVSKVLTPCHTCTESPGGAVGDAQHPLIANSCVKQMFTGVVFLHIPFRQQVSKSSLSPFLAICFSQQVYILCELYMTVKKKVKHLYTFESIAPSSNIVVNYKFELNHIDYVPCQLVMNNL